MALTTLKLQAKQAKTALITIDSECKIIRKIADELKELDTYAECFAKIGESPVYQLFRKHRSHAACPVPLAITKGSEIVAGMALPQEVRITMAKQD